MTDIKEILALIKTTRKQKGITQKQVAGYIGTTEVNYMRIENGETAMKLETYIEICRYLGVELLINKPKQEEKETSLIPLKETDINNFATKNDISRVEDKLDDILKLMKKKK